MPDSCCRAARLTCARLLVNELELRVPKSTPADVPCLTYRLSIFRPCHLYRAWTMALGNFCGIPQAGSVTRKTGLSIFTHASSNSVVAGRLYVSFRSIVDNNANQAI